MCIKKLISVTFALLLIFCLSACGKTKTAETQEAKTTDKSTEQTSSVSIVVVPDVVGMDKDEAVKTLQDLGLKVKLEHYRGSSKGGLALGTEEERLVPNNEVFSQNVASGVLMAKGETINLSYSTLENGYLYDYNTDGTITIDFIGYKVYDSKTGSYTMPKTYDDYIITGIKDSAITALANIAKSHKIYLPKGIKLINTETYGTFEYEEY